MDPSHWERCIVAMRRAEAATSACSWPILTAGIYCRDRQCKACLPAWVGRRCTGPLFPAAIFVTGRQRHRQNVFPVEVTSNEVTATNRTASVSIRSLSGDRTERCGHISESEKGAWLQPRLAAVSSGFDHGAARFLTNDPGISFPK
jgi:hypothetical protein